ncbi:hypothetical protein [Mycolicibacterium insubricum]|uniref:hypothetical protein n=1 Tax=Mycolicibacterium insubricum TaxID=444597 RepID=UPI0021F28EE4|nr:hypothetical protein [Mycolicibacterium insubricum]MCV7082387.1 hypothetical protein [Mycolicibacterium insubricum]
MPRYACPTAARRAWPGVCADAAGRLLMDARQAPGRAPPTIETAPARGLPRDDRPRPEKSAALAGIGTALDAVRKAQQSGNFADYGQALQSLQTAMDAYDKAK